MMSRKDEIVTGLGAARRRILEVVTDLLPEKLDEVFLGTWSVKDLLVHLTWYEREMTDMVKERETAVLELWGLPRKERNQRIYEQQRDQPLEQVLEEHQQIHEMLIQEIERLEDEDLNDPSRTPKMLPDSKLWELLEENIWFHYLLHSEALWAWQERS